MALAQLDMRRIQKFVAGAKHCPACHIPTTPTLVYTTHDTVVTPLDLLERSI